MKRAACTIVSLNYLSYARTLCESFLEHHPDFKFYVLLVDRIPAGMQLSERFELIQVEELGIPDFESLAFKYGVLELNTNVKPTFLKKLLEQNDVVLYLDPDIYVYGYLAPVFDALDTSAITITPHALTPDKRDHGVSELALLKNGAYNLGFIGVRQSAEAIEFLTWWEDRCRHHAYASPRNSVFVDQKWIDLIFCFSNSVFLLKHPGCNVAYWNLHERHISPAGNSWKVNGTTDLLFYHFSGISVTGGDRVSKHSECFTLSNRPDLRPLFDAYRERLDQNGIRQTSDYSYAFGVFDNGVPITPLARGLFSGVISRFEGQNPFSSTSPLYSWLNEKGALTPRRGTAQRSVTPSRNDKRVGLLNFLFKVALRIFGPDRYVLLLRYLAYASVLQNQFDVLEGDSQ